MERRETGRKGWRCLLLLGGLAVAGLAPVAAHATQVAEFDSLHGTRGFGIGVWVRGSNAHLVAVRSSESPIVKAVSAEYEASGQIDGGRVRARFGNRGRVDVEFEQEGEPFRWIPPPRCEGAPRTYRSGVFVGTIGFHGERSFTMVDVSRVSGTLKTIPDWHCKGPDPLPPIHAVPSIDTSPVVLEATRGRRSHRVYFRAVAAHGPSRRSAATFIGGRTEVRPGLRIERFGFVWSARGRSFLTDDRLTEATLDPPWPFGGSATFARGPGGSSWRGPLTVDLPGAGPVRLAGKGFIARLYRGQAEDDPGY